jgi:hypothetical protein
MPQSCLREIGLFGQGSDQGLFFKKRGSCKIALEYWCGLPSGVSCTQSQSPSLSLSKGCG